MTKGGDPTGGPGVAVKITRDFPKSNVVIRGRLPIPGRSTVWLECRMRAPGFKKVNVESAVASGDLGERDHVVWEVGPRWQTFRRAIHLPPGWVGAALEAVLRTAATRGTVEWGGLSLWDGADVGVKTDVVRQQSLRVIGGEPDAPWRKDAAERMESVRTDEIEVTVMGTHGAPRPGVAVEIIQEKGNFFWGTAVGPRSNRAARPTTRASHWYPSLLADRFQALVWPPEGPAETDLAFLRDAGGFLLWDGRDGGLSQDSPVFSGVSGALTGGVLVTARALFGGLSYRDADKWEKGIPFPLVDLGPWGEWPGDFKAPEGFKGALLFRCPFGGAEIQMAKVLDDLEYAARRGLPLWVEGVSIPTLDEAGQSNALACLMTAAVSHPSVVGFTLAGIWEGDHPDPAAALWRMDGTPKPGALAWKDLTTRKFTTRAFGRTDAEGRFKTRAWLGTLRLVLKDDTREFRQRLELARGGLSIALPF